MESGKVILLTVCRQVMVHWNKRTALIGAAVACAAAAVIFLLYARAVLTPEAVGRSLCAGLEEFSGLSIAYESVTAGLFDGIRIRGIRVSGALPGRQQEIAFCDEAVLTCSMSALPFKKLVVRDITLKKPRFILPEDKGGLLRLSGSHRQPAAEAPPLQILLLPRSFMLDNGTMLITDPASGTQVPFDRISIAVPDISLLAPFDISAAAFLSGSDEPVFRFAGSYWLARNEITGRATFEHRAGDAISPLFAAAGIPLARGAFNVSCAVSGSPVGTLKADIECALRDAVLTIYPGTEPDGGFLLETGDAKLSAAAEWDGSQKTCAIERLHGNVCGAVFTGSGRIDARQRMPRIELTLASNLFPLDAFFDRMRVPATSPLQGLKLSGAAGVAFSIAAAADGSPVPACTIALRSNKIVYPPLKTVQPELSGTFRFDNQRIALSDVKIGTDSIWAMLAGDIAGYLRGVPRSSVKIISSEIDFVRLLSFQPDRKPEDIGPFDFKGLSFSGPLQLGAVSLWGIPLGNVQGAYEFEKNRFSIKKLTGAVAEKGRFSLEAAVDLGVQGLDYGARLELADVPVKALRGLLGFDLEPFFDGALSGICTLAGRGTTPDALIRQLTGDARLTLHGGRIKGIGLPPQVLSFLRQDAVTDMAFTEARLHLELAEGEIRLAEGALISSSVEVHPSGTVGIDGELDLMATLKIAETLFAEDSRIASYLPREAGWITLPILIRGTLQRPNVTLSEEAMNYLLQNTLPRLLMEMLGPPPDNETADNATEEAR